jgi:transcriptional regulator with XRE-family HTH domain
MRRQTRQPKAEADKLKQAILERYRQSPFLSPADLAREFGCSRQYVSRVLKGAKLAPGKAVYCDVSQTVATIFELTGWDADRLAYVLGLSRPTVSRWADGSMKASPKHAGRLAVLLDALGREP